MQTHTRADVDTQHQQRLSWGVVELQVTDLQRATAFWTGAIGLHLRQQDDDLVALGTPAKTLILLRSGAKQRVSPGFRGMYHVAIGVPDQAEFSRVLARLVSKGIRVGPTDHLASKSIYFEDPDGIEIEVIFETPERFGRFGDLSRGLVLYDVDGNPHNGRAPLDVKAELDFAAGADVEAPLSPDAFLAHVHFKVADLEAASAWFEGVGFSKGLVIPSFGFADMGAGGGFSHRLAMNIWSGTNAPLAPDDMAGLLRYDVQVHDPAVMENAQGLRRVEPGLTGTDPSGVEITLSPAF